MVQPRDYLVAGGVWSWTAPQTASSPLRVISCPSTTLCVASNNGDILTSTDPKRWRPSWSAAVSVAPENIENISCRSTTLCVATESTTMSHTRRRPKQDGQIYRLDGHYASAGGYTA
jgi:hypothetical protein